MAREAVKVVQQINYVCTVAVWVGDQCFDKYFEVLNSPFN
jgi:hypothetical protein